jgi:hypothetical protein
MVMHVGGGIGCRPEEWWRAPAQKSWSGGELGGGGLGGKVGAAGPRIGARWIGECDGEHEEENTKGKPSALSSQMI